MATTPRLLSGSTNGRGIVIQSTTAASGTVIHTAVTAGTVTTFDEVYVQAVNLTTTSKKLILNAGGLVSGDRIQMNLPSASNGLFLLVPGNRYNGGVVIRAYATVAGKVAVHGYCNRTV